MTGGYAAKLSLTIVEKGVRQERISSCFLENKEHNEFL